MCDNSILGCVGVVLVDQEDLAFEGTLTESSILSSGLFAHPPDGSPVGKDDGPFPFTLLLLLKFARVAEANAADGELEDDGEEEEVFGPFVLIAAPGRGPPDATPAGRVYEHWYVERPPLVRSSRIAKTYFIFVIL